MSVLETTSDGLRLRLHIQPRASKTEIAGVHGDSLKIRIAAPPVEGAANDELLRFLADTLGVPGKNLEIASGHGSRRKTVRIHGISESGAGQRLGLSPEARPHKE